MASDSVLSPFTAGDGENLAIHDWPLPDMPEQKNYGTVIIVHGLGEHAFRYAHVAEFLNAQGFHVRAYDHYGHGESGGERGGLPSEMRLVDDLADVVEATRHKMRFAQQTHLPLFLLGHSMGGVVAASFVQQHQHARPVHGLILSSPAFDPGLSGLQKLMLSVLPRLLPELRVNNGLKISQLCRSEAVRKAYLSDRLVHRKVSARLASFIAREGANMMAAAPAWAVPTLLLYAGADALVNPAGSRAFAAAAPALLVQTHCFEAMHHEILNDPDQAQVFEKIGAWLTTRTQPQTQ